MSDSTKLGNAGENLIMAELLERGHHAFRADRANPAFDISVVSGQKHSLLRVKTTASRNVQWSSKAGGTIFLEMQPENDFVALVDMRNGVRGAGIYIIPTPRVDKDIRSAMHTGCRLPSAMAHRDRWTIGEGCASTAGTLRRTSPTDSRQSGLSIAMPGTCWKTRRLN